MSGTCESGKCEICGKEGLLQRTYFNYNIKCECHSPNHFDLVRHCKDCIPKEPRETKVFFKTEDLKNPIPLAMKIVKNALKADKSEGSWYYSWQSNIACKIMDNSDVSHDKANEIAIAFLELLIND
jgi:hypothetical protein